MPLVSVIEFNRMRNCRRSHPLRRQKPVLTKGVFMRIAVTYDKNDGSVFQHFGKTENFKLYEIENGKVVSSAVIGNGGAGHEALAGVLADNRVDAVLCGGLGQGMLNALAGEGIEVYPGATGSADDALQAFLEGTLQQGEANCDHHGHEEEDGECGRHCGSGEGCGHCCGGERKVSLEGKNAGKVVRVHYRGTLDDGTQFDSSYDSEPMEYVCGTGMMIRGFDRAVVNMDPGDSVDVHLLPDEAYGNYNPQYVLHLKVADVPGSEDLEIGQQVYLKSDRGGSFPVIVTDKDDENITLDANSEFAGKELNFHIELLSVSD